MSRTKRSRHIPYEKNTRYKSEISSKGRNPDNRRNGRIYYTDSMKKPHVMCDCILCDPSPKDRKTIQDSPAFIKATIAMGILDWENEVGDLMAEDAFYDEWEFDWAETYREINGVEEEMDDDYGWMDYYDDDPYPLAWGWDWDD